MSDSPYWLQSTPDRGTGNVVSRDALGSSMSPRRTAWNAIRLERELLERAHHPVLLVRRAETHVFEGRFVFHPTHPLASVDHGRGLLAKVVSITRFEDQSLHVRLEHPNIGWGVF